ncbi:MAG: hypothetical protein GY835_13175 [bacterium]|nr:hypothetical protein [bacterium]
MTTRFGFIPVSSEALPSVEALEEILGHYGSALRACGGEQRLEGQLTDPLPLFWLVVTGGAERTILKLVEERAQTAPAEPVLLLAHPAHNSLPAALEVLARLRREGRRGRVIYLAEADAEPVGVQIEAALADLKTGSPLRGLRLGLLGEPSSWLVAGVSDQAMIRRVWGPEVVPLAMSEVKRAIAEVDIAEAAGEAAALAANAISIIEPGRADIEDAVRVRIALQRLVEQYHLDAFTIRCFDLVTDLQTTGCLALAALCDAGVIAGCEGDLVSALGLLWAHRLLGETPWMANPARIDERRNSLWLAHCTVPLGLVEGYSLRSHFESGLGLGLQGELPSGPVTLLRIGGSALERLWLAEGQILRAGNEVNLCRTQVEIQLVDGAVTDLLNSPLGNHLVLVRGRHKDRLHDSWRRMNIG